MRKIVLGILILVVLVSSALLVERSMQNTGTSDQAAQRAEKILPGDLTVMNFQTKQPVPLKSFAGKVVLINFWASWCEACIAEMPSIQKLYDLLKGEGFEVIAVNVDEKPQDVVPGIIKKLNLTFPIYTEENSAMSKQFEVVAIPYTVVADRTHKIIWSESGERDWASPQVIAEIRKLLKPT